MKISTLLNKRLILVSGKGGVGKTSISILLALKAEMMNKRTLIVEMNSSGRVAPVFHQEPVLHQEVSVTPLISYLNLDPDRCFEEAVVRQIRFTTLYRAFFENKYVANFQHAIPGLNEFMMVDKLVDLESKVKNKFISRTKKKYDLIIVDAPATGHGLSVLEIPGIIHSAVTIGPQHVQAGKMLELFRNHQKTIFCIVTLAEEMPVCESEEYIRALKARTELAFGPLFINGVMPEIQPIVKQNSLPKEMEIFWKYYTLSKERAELNKMYIEEIEHRFPDFTKITIPFHFRGLHFNEQFIPLVQLLQEK